MSTSHRHRIEDLGRLSALLDDILEDDLFDNIQYGAKRWPDWFWARTIEEQHDIIYSIGYGIDRVQEKISKCSDIADGTENALEESNIIEEMKKFMQGFAYRPPEKKEEEEYEP